MTQNLKLPKKKIVVWCLIVVAVYIVLTVSLYFLMGEQLHFRNSRGNIDFSAKNVPCDINDFSFVEQHFSAKIHRINSLSVKWYGHQPTDTATATVTLCREDTGAVIVSQQYSFTKPDGDFVTDIIFEVPNEDLYEVPLILTVSSNEKWMPLFRETRAGESKSLVGGYQAAVTMDFAVKGQDYVWTGQNYWWLALGGLALVLILIAVVILRYRISGYSFVVNCFTDLGKYKFLISQLVSRDFKTKYKRSFFGVLWSFLNPLLTTFVMYFVFSNVFRGWGDIDNYTAYLIIGVTMFNFFNECCTMCLNSIVGNAHMITKVFVPKYIYPLTKTLSSGINFALALIPLFIIVLINKLVPSLSWILILFPFLCMMIFCLGLGLLLASSMVYFRDTQFLWGVICMLWMYLTPIFYPADIIPASLSWVQACNPMYQYIDFVRTCIIGGISPEPVKFVYCFASALIMLVVGGLVFKKARNNFVLYI